MRTFFFPLNYKYSEKFLGIIEYKILLPISIYLAIIIFILHLLNVDLFVGISVVIVLGLPPLLLLSYGVNGQPIIPYLKAVILFKLKKNIYIYSK